jgi:hypothetical protein
MVTTAFLTSAAPRRCPGTKVALAVVREWTEPKIESRSLRNIMLSRLFWPEAGIIQIGLK